MTEARAELPEGWEWIKLGDVCKALRGVTFSSGEARSEPFDGGVACLTTSGVQNEVAWGSRRFIPKVAARREEQFLRCGDILVSTANSKALVGKSCVITELPFECTFGAFVTVLRPKNIAAELLAYWMRSPDALSYFYEKSSNTTNISNLKVNDLLALEMPLPPLEEQRRILEALQMQMAEVDKARAATQAQLEAAGELPSAFLTDLFDQLLECPQRQVREVASFSSGGTPSKARADYWNGDIPWVSPKDMHVSVVADAQDHVSESAVSESSTKLVEAGTILVVTRSGILARLLPVTIAARSVTFNQDIKAIMANRELILPEFLRWAIKVRENHILTRGVKVGATVHSLRSGFLESLEIPVPPLDEQKRLLEVIYEQQTHSVSLRQALTTQLETINALPASLLRQAFSGELTRQPSPEDLRAALTCLAVERLHHRVFFGVVQLMKVLYFAQAHHSIPLGYTIRRHTYGPFDKAVYDLEKEGEREGWFSVDKAVDKQGSRYVPGAELDSLAREAKVTLGCWKGELDGLLELAESFDTTGLEALATLHAAWNDLLLEGRQPTDSEIISEVLEGWPGKAEKFHKGELRQYLAYLKATPYIPKGTGQSTRLTHAA